MGAPHRKSEMPAELIPILLECTRVACPPMPCGCSRFPAQSADDVSTGHAGKLWEVEWLFPLQPALGKHLQHRRDQFRSIQAAESHKDSAGETVQIVGKHASAAVRTEVAIEALAGFSDIVERLRLAAEEREIIFRHTKERRRRATGGPFAVVAMAGRDKSRIRIELELHCPTSALCRVFLAHVIHLALRDKGLCYFAFLFRVSIRSLAAGPDEAGFWPVINCPSLTVWTPQFLTLEKMAPRRISSSSTRKGTTFVRPTSSSSPSVKPVTFLPSTSGLSPGVLTWRSAPGAWQTKATSLPAARKDSISLIEFLSSARSHIGPWPPG